MRVAHIFVHSTNNAGDIYLKRAVQMSFTTIFPDAIFNEIEMRKIFTNDDIAILNSHDFIIIGGGGLLLRDTFPNDVSDWQWGCSVELLESITVPIVVYSIGYNRFRNQEDFNRSVFDEHIELLIQKSLFFSVRNNGSRQALKDYVSKDLYPKIHLNFCPSILFPQVIIERNNEVRKVGFLLACDRLHLRHPNISQFIKQVRLLLKEISNRCEIYVVAHQPNDFWYIDEIDGIPFHKVELVGRQPKEVIAFYSGLDVMIGDRGHSQMIPFGLGCKIISLVSHNKLQWFLDDIHMSEYGVEESDKHLAEKTLSLIFPNSKDLYWEKRIRALRYISRLHYSNLGVIREKILSSL